MAGRRRRERVTSGLEGLVEWIEVLVAGLLVLLVLVVVASVAQLALRTLASFPPEERAVLDVLGGVLQIFIIIELFRITVAYARHRDVIPTVLETALVVAAREIVVVEAGSKDPVAAAGAAGVMVVVGVTWYLLYRARARTATGGASVDDDGGCPASREETG